MRDGNVIQDDSELRSPLGQVVVDLLRDQISLGDQLSGVELGHDGLQHFGGDRRKDSLFVVLAQDCVDARQLVGNRSEQDAEGDVDVLQVFAAGYDGDVSGAGSDVEDDGSLDPRDEEVGAFADDLLLDAGEPVEDYGSVAAVHCKFNSQYEEWFESCEKMYTSRITTDSFFAPPTT